ncbi:MAG: (4Fe-4S)-binding protein [Desulfobacterales bacterium]|nr:(4Fe-4S)-binding protein [Desulfobacterales bacterium]
MSYKNTVICFWSGTGNSYRVSTWMGTIAKENGLNIQVSSIDKSNPTEEITCGNDSLIGIVFPTHGFTAPWHMLKYVWNLPRGNSTHAFCVATRAGLKFGSVFIPGISGTAMFIIALILKLKGYHVRGTRSVDMPSNWYSLHPIQHAESHEAIFNRARHNINHFMERILSNRKVWFSINNLYEITLGILLLPLSAGYLMIGRFFLAKLFFANNNCNGCGICSDYCSVGAIKMRGKKNPMPFWKYNCESCMRCAAFCPNNAVEAGHSWGIILYFITAVPISAYLFSWLDRYIPGIGSLEGHWIGDILNFMYYYPAIFISYCIFSVLIQLPVINWLFTHTTMTHFWGRYREPGTKLKNIAAKKKDIT